MSGIQKPKVLLLGDSIRMSYQPIVAELLVDEAEVVGPAENCQFSLYTLSALQRWLAELGNPDIVHWNNGIHDAGHNPNRRPIQIPLDVYAGNIELILKSLQATNAQVIWGTITPVHPERPFRDDEWAWRNEEIGRYNDAALAIMAEQGVPVNDLHAVVSSDVGRYLAEDMLHLSEEGQHACAEAVAGAVRKIRE